MSKDNKNFDSAYSQHEKRLEKYKNGKKGINFPKLIKKILISPIYLIVLVFDKISNFMYDNQKWSDKKTTHIINKYLPKIADIVTSPEDERGFWYCLEWHDWIWRDNCKWYDKVYITKHNSAIVKFLHDDYIPPTGYKKELSERYYGEEHWIRVYKSDL